MKKLSINGLLIMYGQSVFLLTKLHKTFKIDYMGCFGNYPQSCTILQDAKSDVEDGRSFWLRQKNADNCLGNYYNTKPNITANPVKNNFFIIKIIYGKDLEFMGISIVGTGMYVPERIATNEDFTKIIDTSDEWITSRTGIKSRHIATDENTWQMGTKAAEAAILNAGVSKDDIGLVLVTSVTTDYYSPSTACLIANGAGIKNAACLDINVACAGFVYAVDMAKKYLNDDSDLKYVLIISAEMMTKMVDYADRSTCVLFGDGAGACVLTGSDKPFFSCLGSDPSGVIHLSARAQNPSNPFMDTPFDPTSDGISTLTSSALYQNGKEVYKFATAILPQAVHAVCQKAGKSLEDVSLIIPHQANLRIIKAAASKLDMPEEKMFVNIEEYGNMSSACIPIALHQAITTGRLKKGNLVCLVGFGAGLVYGACLFEI